MPESPFRLLRWFCHPMLLEDIEGDLAELFELRGEQSGMKKAKLRLWLDVILLFRPGIIRPFNGNYNINRIDMFKNYLKVFWRNLRKHKNFSLINIFSLTSGIAACLVIFLFVQDELAFDGMHSKKDNLYRLCEIQTWEGTNPQKVPISWPKMGYALPDYFPEVKSYTRYYNVGQHLWKSGDLNLLVESSAYVDSNFLDVFDFEMSVGAKVDVLSEPNTMVVSESVAKAFFNTTDVIGKTMEWGEDRVNKITGVMKDISENSHLQFDILVSMATITSRNPDFNDRTGSNFIVTYIELHEHTDIAAMEEKFPSYLEYLTDDEEITEGYQLFLQSLADVHLASTEIEHDYQNYRKFNGAYINVFILTGIFILIIASVNFMNLTAARSNTRAKEVGVRKSIGVRKYQLVSQFIFESVLMALIALVFAVGITAVVIPYLNELISREIEFTNIFAPQVFLTVLGTTVSLGLLTGLYPSIHLSTLKAIKALKGVNVTYKMSLFRSSMVVAQFSLALGMIVCTLVVMQQLFYIKNKDIGFDKDHILLVTMNGEANDNYKVMKEEMQGLSSVLGVTASGQRLGNNFHQWGFKVRKDTAIVPIVPSNVLVDYNYLDVYGIKLKSGRGFSQDNPTDNGYAFVINEAFAKELTGKEDEYPVGMEAGLSWYPDDTLGTIVGVVENFNFNSLHYKVNTLSMVVQEDWYFSELSVKLNGGNLQEGIQEVEAIWHKHVSDFPFKYEFLDQHFEEVYRSEQQMMLVITSMAVLSILIGCMGLYGLASITIERRIKEIGIRKVLGASVGQLLVMQSKGFALLIAVSFLVATPLTYLYLQGWLQNFAYKIDINPMVFVLGGLLSFAIAMGTISFHTVRAAISNPVKCLRSE